MVQSVMLRSSVLKFTPTFTMGRFNKVKRLSYCFNSICSKAYSAYLLSFISMMYSACGAWSTKSTLPLAVCTSTSR